MRYNLMKYSQYLFLMSNKQNVIIDPGEALSLKIQ